VEDRRRGHQVGTHHGIVFAETAGGTIDVESARAVVRAETASGLINLRRIAGPVRAENGGGQHYRHRGCGSRRMGRVDVGTHSGDVDRLHPANLAMTIRATIEMLDRGGISARTFRWSSRTCAICRHAGNHRGKCSSMAADHSCVAHHQRKNSDREVINKEKHDESHSSDFSSLIRSSAGRNGGFSSTDQPYHYHQRQWRLDWASAWQTSRAEHEYA